METVRFGKTGMKVSRLCLGCMTYGSTKWRDWVLEEEASRPFIREALERGINFFDTADMYSDRRERGDRRPGAQGLRQARRSRGRHQGLQSDGAGAERARPVAQAHHGGDRRLAEAARHGLCRSLPDPSLRLRDADRGDGRGAERRRARRQGALCRRLVDVGLAVRAHDLVRARARLRRIRLDAEFLQSRLSRGRARDDAVLRRSGDRGDSLVAAGARLSGGLGRRRGRGRFDGARALRRLYAGAGPRLAPGRGDPPARSSRPPSGSASSRRSLRSPGCCRSLSSPSPIIGASKPHHLEDAVAALSLKLDARTIAKLEEPYHPKAVVGHH